MYLKPAAACAVSTPNVCLRTSSSSRWCVPRICPYGQRYAVATNSGSDKQGCARQTFAAQRQSDGRRIGPVLRCAGDNTRARRPLTPYIYL